MIGWESWVCAFILFALFPSVVYLFLLAAASIVAAFMLVFHFLFFSFLWPIAWILERTGRPAAMEFIKEHWCL